MYLVIENVGQCSPGVYLRDDPVSGTQLQNQSELRAPTAEKAAYYLDAALATRTMSFNEEESRLSHFLFTLHVYQYRVERGTTGSAGQHHNIIIIIKIISFIHFTIFKILGIRKDFFRNLRTRCF